MKRQFATFLIRLILNSVGIWVAVRLLGNETPGATSAWTFMMAGLIFSVVNSVLKPIVTILALPATLIVNGFMVYISLALAPGISMTFAHSIIAGIILSLVNYIISSALVLQREEKE